MLDWHLCQICYTLEIKSLSDDFVLIFIAKVSIVSVISPFLQLQRQRKMAARFFLHGDHLAKVVLSGTPFLRPVQYDYNNLT